MEEKLRERYDCVIIGAGVSGLSCATGISGGKKVLILEHMSEPAKKLLETGNGRCNFTNKELDETKYYGDKAFVRAIIRQYDTKRITDYFEKLGLAHIEKNGYIYPMTNRADSVKKMFLNALKYKKDADITIKTKIKIINAKKDEKNDFLIKVEDGVFACKKLVLACGSKAAPHTGSDGSGYDMAKSFSHSVNPVLPALTKLHANKGCQKSWSGIRIYSSIKLFEYDNKNDRRIYKAEAKGELQLTKSGISGIPAFQVSRFASILLNRHKQVYCAIDFLPYYTEEELYTKLDNMSRLFPEKTIIEHLSGFIQEKLIKALLQRKCGLVWQKTDKSERKNIIKSIKEFLTQITGTGDFDESQTCCGGVISGEIDPYTMRSKLTENLYIIGEMIDLDGLCGGYNLHIAVSEGLICAKDI